MNNGTILIRKENFAIASCKSPLENAMVTISDNREITCIISEEKLVYIQSEKIISKNEGWRCITFNEPIPLGTIGFFARVTNALAQAGVGVDIYSAYSRDHFLVKNTDLEKAIRALEGLGYIVENPS